MIRDGGWIEKLKVMIADDQKLLRDCMRHMIQKHSDIEVVACAENGAEAVALYKQHKPDLILMDIQMPVCDGIEATRQIKETGDSTKVLMLTTSERPDDLEEALRIGADGYVLKNISAEELILAIRSVYSGLDIIHRGMLKAAVRSREQSAEEFTSRTMNTNGVNVSLSERDLWIIRLIADGKDTSEIARELFLTEGRVRNIISEIIARLALRDRAQLVAFAYKNHLV